MNYSNSCGCEASAAREYCGGSLAECKIVPGMAYVPDHDWDIYDGEKGFSRGTLFPVLDKPFYGKRGMCL